MLTRRHMLQTALAATAVGALPATAQRTWTLPEEYKPKIVRLAGNFVPGEVHVDPNRFNLYWTLPDGKAIRYVVGIGRSSQYESGSFYVGAKKEWPGWRPTDAMIEREPEKYKQFEDGMPGGPGNPLGSRALYLFTKGRGDTFLRIHGTFQPWTIASAISNGCVRLTNSHIAHLYNQVPLGTKVVLH